MQKKLNKINKDKDFVAKSKAQKELLEADFNNVSEVLLTGPGSTGKSVSLCISSMGPQRDGSFLVDNPNYVGLILRREATQLEKTGLIRTCLEWYKKFYPNLEYNGSLKRVTFPSGAIINFGGCESEDDALKYKGASKLHYLGLEEGTQYTQKQIDILTTRLRDADNVIPLRVRIGTNSGENEEPLLERYKYWLWKSCIHDLNPSIKAKYGQTLYRYIDTDHPDMPLVVVDKKPDRTHETFLCIETKVNDIIKDNAQQMGKITDPILREQLLNHIWGLKAQAGMYFSDKDLFETTFRPTQATKIRYWDKACSGEQGDYLCGMLTSHYLDGKSKFIMENVVLLKTEAPKVKDIILSTAAKDGKQVYIGFEQEPGSAGKELMDIYKRDLEKLGYKVIVDVKKESKQNRAQYISPIAKEGRIGYIPSVEMTEVKRQLVSFPSKGVNDDAVDACSGSIFLLLNRLPPPIRIEQKSTREMVSLFERLDGIRQL